MNILVIRGGALGDFVLTLPALRVLREAFPKAHVEIMGHPEIAELAKGRYYADSVTPIDQACVASLFTREGAAPRDFSRYLARFDIAVSYCHDSDHTVPRNLSRSGVSRVVSISPKPYPPDLRHAADHFAEGLRPLGVVVADSISRVFLSAADREFALEFWRQRRLPVPTHRPLVAIHPGSGSPSKCWPARRFAAVADVLATKHDASLILIRGPADGEAAAQFLHGVRNARPAIAEGLSPLELASLLSSCDACLGSDSGVSHLAAAVGTPTVAVFGPTDPRVWGPRGQGVTTVREHMGCSPCEDEQRRRCPRRSCLEAVSVERVRQALERIQEPTTKARRRMATGVPDAGLRSTEPGDRTCEG